jgi:quercetin dioxygenase-like cupin family protein
MSTWTSRWAGALLTATLTLAPALADDQRQSETATGVAFTTLLSNVPGTRLTAVVLKFPRGTHPTIPHRHTGAVYVYVVEGSLKMGLDGQPVQLLHAGDSFFEPPGSHHVVAENASTTHRAVALALVIHRDGDPVLTVDK